MTATGMRKLMREDQALGPLASDGLHRQHWDEFLQLYDDENVLHRLAKRSTPTLIIGRKGSGKTSLLMGSQQNNTIAVLGTGTVYTNFHKINTAFESKGSRIYDDGLAQLWQLGFWHVIFLRLLKEHHESEAPGHVQTLIDYVTGALKPRNRTIADAGSTDMFGAYATLASDLIRPEGSFITTPDDLEICLEAGGISYSNAKNAAELLLSSRPKKIAIVIDNLEDLALKIDDPSLQNCLRGLLHLIGAQEFGARDDSPFLVRKCFPSELMPRLYEISSSPEKDFSSRLTINWVAKEIIVMAARRWWIHLDVYGETRPADIGFSELEKLSDHNVAKDFMRALLPKLIINGYGHPESGLGYLMRHTQLLPRHLIGLLNKTLESCPASDVPEGALVAGVVAGEKILAQGILSSYRTTFEMPDDALKKLVGRVPNVLSRSHFHNIYNKAGVKKVNGLQFTEFVDHLVKIGAVGRVMRETERYFEATFYYTHEGRLEVPVDDHEKLAFHPLFSRYLSCLDAKPEVPEAKAVYPYGSDPDLDDDYRIYFQ